mmetsp:Transcript_84922/g.274517  ORF Transcript_84922/g.274517 Transcript_84922/m.274517 type:complete len:84 (-) Transcript_84922:245-496(-)
MTTSICSTETYLRLTLAGQRQLDSLTEATTMVRQLSLQWNPTHDPAKYKTELCAFFSPGLSNECKKGDSCPYAHGQDDLRIRT